MVMKEEENDNVDEKKKGEEKSDEKSETPKIENFELTESPVEEGMFSLHVIDYFAIIFKWLSLSRSSAGIWS